MKMIIALLLVSIWWFVATGQAHPSKLVFCHEDQDSYPWELTDGSGLNIELLRLLEEKLDIPLELPAVPWKRCMRGLASNEYDGAFAASFTPEREAFGHYPRTPDGKLDASKRLHASGYTLYKLKSSNLHWDGKRLVHLLPTQIIAYQTDFSIGNTLRALGVKKLDGSSKKPELVMQKLILKRVEAVALQSFNGDHLLYNSPEFRHHIVAMEPPLIEKPYYLMLSKRFTARHPNLSQRIWALIENIRESEAYKEKAALFLNAHSDG